MPVLNGMGFSIEKNAGNFIVYAVPEPVVRMDFNRFLAELFSHMLDDGELKLADLVKEVVCPRRVPRGDQRRRASDETPDRVRPFKPHRQER